MFRLSPGYLDFTSHQEIDTYFDLQKERFAEYHYQNVTKLRRACEQGILDIEKSYDIILEKLHELRQIAHQRLTEESQ